jgi:hypothetical protein
MLPGSTILTKQASGEPHRMHCTARQADMRVQADAEGCLCHLHGQGCVVVDAGGRRARALSSHQAEMAAPRR